MANGKRTPGTHFQGPLLGSNRAGGRGGLFEDVALGRIDGLRSPFKVYSEDFDRVLTDGDLALQGATVTDLNTATSPSEVVTGATGYLEINPGTKNDSGTSVQFNAVASGTAANDVAPWHLPSVVSTATLMDDREMFFVARVGFKSSTAAWDGKAIVGWCETDTTPLATATGALTLAGGAGFHVGEDGVLGYFGSSSAITSATATSHDITTLDAADTYKWFTLGLRHRGDDASAGTGEIAYFVNGVEVGTISSGLPMNATDTYSATFTIVNGPALDSDLAVDYVAYGFSRPGLTYPYTDGTPY